MDDYGGQIISLDFWRRQGHNELMVLAHLVKSEAACFTLAIQKRSGEVWEMLGAIKTEFGKFGDVMDKLKGHLERASKTIDDVGVRKRAMDRRLRGVEELPQEVADETFGFLDGDR